MKKEKARKVIAGHYFDSCAAAFFASAENGEAVGHIFFASCTVLNTALVSLRHIYNEL